MIYFKYQNKVYETPNLEKKLKRMKLHLEDVELINEQPKVKNSDDEDNGVKKYYFVNPLTNYTITSIYDEIPEKGYVRQS